jgi:hypothetical protein
LTYARRYSLAALVGLVTEDDDAEMACGRKHPKESRKRANGNGQSSGYDDGEGNSASHYEAELKSGSEAESVQTREILKSLPKLDGINYQTVKATDGQLCIVATGNTAAKKEILSNTGFRWNTERKIWWKYAA